MTGVCSGRMLGRALVTGLLALPLLVACGEDDPEPGARALPAWSDGRTVWWGEEAVETGQPRLLRSFTTTQDAVVWIDSRGEVWSAAPGSEPVAIGSAGRTEELVADRFGSLVAWVDVPDVEGGEQARLQVYDTAAEELAVDSPSGLGDDMRHAVQFYTELSPWPPRDRRPLGLVLAVDGETVWWSGDRGLMATDVATGTAQVVRSEQVTEGDFAVLDAAGTTLATWPFDPDDPEASPPAEAGGVALSGGFSGVSFSPDGRHALAGGEVDLVSDGSTALPAPDGVELTQWVDDETVAGLRVEGRELELVSCDLDGGCTTYGRSTAETPQAFTPALGW